MAEGVKRQYRSVVRSERAAATRRSVLAAAQLLFTDVGYAQTSVADVAERAGVSVDTVYTSVGRKPHLLLAVLDMTLGSATEPVPAEQRDYVVAIREADGAHAKIGVYAAALGRLMPRVVPLLEALAEAAATDEECARMRDLIADRRAANMRLFAADLRVTGELRADLSDDDVGDLVWATNSPQYFALLRQRGWSATAYADHLADLWARLLLAPGRA
ncbi:TetR/AcrR family transcriptional regulator [Nocardioides currus]|uniref:TetR/AcrR family transcriptional regulator n=1 Tax=Nocardioides currus TaxID=2133958 RepID=A0A2R7YVE9_9ACTN|nr:TetR/AcrR family transcriptional regulator [Nocardioides currus]PUA80348.1 TetR/AcrR family transcriptional regulator [Nocardioides currus]